MDERPRPRLVIVSGVPGSGKTTLARELADAMHLPLVVRDEIKQGMHVTVDSVDPAERRRFSSAAFAAFYDVLGRLLDTGVSVVGEAAFHAELAAADLAPLVARSRAVVVHCRVDPAISSARYVERAQAKVRHPAHGEIQVAADMLQRAFPWNAYEPPNVDAPRIDVDTTDGYRPDLATLVARIRSATVE